MRSIIVAIICFSLFSSCKKELTYNTMLKSELSVEFDNIAGGADLQLTTATYTNALSETFKVTKLKYYVSNFVLTNTNGTVYTVPKDSCYFLIDESDEDTHEPILNVPEGEYKTLSFLLGVDSLKNAADVSERTGSLDPGTTASDMYWGWNQGYIFFKMDGTSPLITSMGNAFQYHVGGFGGYNSATPNNLKTITLDLTTRGTPKVKAGKETNIHLFVDILKALNGTTNMSFATSAMIHSISAGVPVANNYANMFTHDHTEN
ncbi:MAG: MbnP family protein [Bacteroidota bacterium]